LADRPDDPVLQVSFAPEHKRALEKLVTDLPVEVFTAEDSLGWVYQFWQAERKEERGIHPASACVVRAVKRT